MITDTAQSLNAELRERAVDLFPGGVNSPVRAYRAVGGEPPIIERGAGPAGLGRRRSTSTSTMSAPSGPLILGHADPAVVPTLHAAGRSRRAVRRHDGGRGRARRGHPGRHALARADAVRELRHRGRHERAAPGARGDRPRPDREVRRRLPRPRRRPARRGRLGPRDAGPARECRRHGCRRRADARRCRTTTRPRCARPSPSMARGSPRSSSSPSPPTWASCRRPQASSRRSARRPAGHGALLIFDEVITGFRVGPRRRAGASTASGRT